MNTMRPNDQGNPNNLNVLMLLTNAFDPDPRVHQEASSLVQNGYNVTILCWDRDYKKSAYEMIDGIKIERIYVRSSHGRGSTQVFFLFLFWLKAYIRACSKDFHIVHSHDFDTLPLGYALSKQRSAKLIYDSHESYVDMLGNLPSWLRRTIYRLENFFLKRTDLLITVGELLREALAKRGAKNTCVVGNWKDPDKFKFPEEILEEEKRRLHILNGQLVISFIANLGLERQLPQLIEAVKETPDTFLIVGGDGPCRNIAEDAAQRHSNIGYLGYVNPLRVPLYTAMSDIIFYGFDPHNPNAKYSAPNKLFEALAAGKTIMTCDFGEIGKIVKERGCGIILKGYSKDEIKRALNFIKANGIEAYQSKAREAGFIYHWKRAEEILLKNYCR